MEVILLEKVQNLGNLGDKVSVRPGYGRNFLVPQGKATPATQANLEEFEKRRTELERAEAGALGTAQARADLLKDLSVTIARKAGDEGRLFGSVGTGDIAEAIAATGVEIQKQEIRLPEGALRRTGEYDVAVHLHTDINASVKVEIVAE